MPNLHPRDAHALHLGVLVNTYLNESVYSSFRSQATAERRQLLLGRRVTKRNNSRLNCDETNIIQSSARPERSAPCSFKAGSGWRALSLPCKARSCRERGRAAHAPTSHTATGVTPGNKQIKPLEWVNGGVEEVTNMSPALRRQQPVPFISNTGFAEGNRECTDVPD